MVFTVITHLVRAAAVKSLGDVAELPTRSLPVFK
jgi:hypothetical protein